MKKLKTSALAALLAVFAVPAAVLAQARPTAVCPLVPKEEVKKHFPWMSALDQMPVEEEAIGTNGSSCNYPTVLVQLLPWSSHTVETLKKSGSVETAAGVGDAAWLRNNRGEYAEIFVKVGDRLLTLQASIDGDFNESKPKLVALAKEYVGKLR
jgi:hypothetical protein